MSTQIEAQIEKRRQQQERFHALMAEVEGHLMTSPDGQLAVETGVQLPEEFGKALEDALAYHNQHAAQSEALAQPGTRATDRYQPPLGYTSHWWGWQLALSDAATKNVIHLVSAGAGVATIAAAISTAAANAPAAVASGIAAGALTVGSAFIALMNDAGGNKGVYWENLWVSGIMVPPDVLPAGSRH